MTLSPFRFCVAALASWLLIGTAHGQTAIIAKARAYLGTDAALGAITSIHCTGEVGGPDAADPSKAASGTIDIIFQKPLRHRVTLTTDKSIEITGLDGYEGWQRVTPDKADPTKWQQIVVGPEPLKRLRANVWEALSFFRGIEGQGGRIEVLQPTTI